jgi:uncharacterized membrane protein YedE/YeeE
MNSFFAEQCPWWLAGAIAGLVVVALQWIANLPLGMTGTIVGLQTWVKRPAEGASWRVYFLAGVLGGAFLYTIAFGHFAAGFANGMFDARFAGGVSGATMAKAMTLVGAGGFIGFGSRLADGCTSGHALCGLSRGSGTSLVTVATFMGVAVAMTNVIYRVIP